jgi:hypothetical protein
MAPDSNTAIGAPASAGSLSTMAGSLLFGLILRNSGVRWVPAYMSYFSSR